MSIKIGNVIENESGLHVITEITNDLITETERLEDYISKNALVHEDGRWITIKEVIERRCDMYLASGVKIIEE